MLKLVITEDGSHTLYSEKLKETYHSLHGAWQESIHVYLKNGLEHYVSQNNFETIKVFEIGFGTGMNAILTLDFAEKQKKNIEMTSIEPFPIPTELVKQMNYKQFFEPKMEIFWQKIHESEWENKQEISPFFALKKLEITFEKLILTERNFDVIYYDAFAPSKQAEIWSLENLNKAFELLKPNGILVTYCAKGQFKRDLKSVGFAVESLKGAKGKMEMVRGKRLV